MNSKYQKLTCFILTVLLSSCANISQTTRETNVMRFTPRGCYYVFLENRFDCDNKEEENYLNKHTFTKYELDELGSLVDMDETTVNNLFYRLHDCTIKPQDSAVYCKYQISLMAMSNLSNKFNIIEKEDGNQFVYVVTGQK